MRTRVTEGHAPTEGTEADEALGRVRLLLQRLEAAPHDRSLATSLNQAIIGLARTPSRDVAELLRELSGLEGLRHAQDSKGRSCRAAAIAARLQLGYPWALEVTPEELEFVRGQRPGNANGWLNLTFVFAALTALQNLGVIVAAVALMFIVSPTFLILAPVPMLNAAHAVGLARASWAGLDDSFVVDRLRRLTRIEWLIPMTLVLLAVAESRLGMLAWFAPQLLALAMGRLAARAGEAAD
ncbi:MAG: hypothetical protein JNM69_05915 [Archangium sp.]|nr:hypothetical protein [Archangium sp.]